jgi:hypothetical protein
MYLHLSEINITGTLSPTENLMAMQSGLFTYGKRTINP